MWIVPPGSAGGFYINRHARVVSAGIQEFDRHAGVYLAGIQGCLQCFPIG
jgi:hypothetical protein